MTVKTHHSVFALQQWAKVEARPKVARRLQMVAMAQKGLKGATIAELMGGSPRTVRRWVKRYNEQGVQGLADRPRPGQPPKLADDQQVMLRQRLEVGPGKQDPRSVWHGQDIQQLLEAEFGAIYSLSGVYALLHRLGYRWLCPRPQHEQADPAAQQAFKKTSSNR